MVIEVFEINRDSHDKQIMKKRQSEYMKHNDWRYNCMCNYTFRKIAHRKFYEWYDAQRN